MDFSIRIKELCKAKGIMQKELAEKLGITPIGLSQALHQQYPQLQTLERIANALNVDISDLFANPGTQIVRCPHCGASLKITIEEAQG